MSDLCGRCGHGIHNMQCDNTDTEPDGKRCPCIQSIRTDVLMCHQLRSLIELLYVCAPCGHAPHRGKCQMSWRAPKPPNPTVECPCTEYVTNQVMTNRLLIEQNDLLAQLAKTKRQPLLYSAFGQPIAQ